MAASGKVALVVGAGSGMARLAARRWADAGGVAVACDVNEDGLRETAEGRPQIHVRPLDVTNFSAVEAVVKEVESELGPIERVDNAAAIQPTELLLDMSPDEVHRVMQINYGGVVNVTYATLPRMLERGRGDLVQYGSIAGWIPNMHFGAYNASKFAVVAFSEVLYHETRGRGVRMVCVCPSSVNTPLLLQARSDPKILKTGPAPMPPEQVLGAIDRALAKGTFFVFPGFHTRMGVLLRRFLPGVMWRIDHRAEGF